MTKEQMRIAVAESLGLEDIHRATRKGVRDANGVRLLYLSNATGGKREYSDVPNYPESLDACKEFEDKMDLEELDTYATHIYDWAQKEEERTQKDNESTAWGVYIVTCPAEQRCIAYLKTKGLWKD